jgi:hypothetical protein
MSRHDAGTTPHFSPSSLLEVVVEAVGAVFFAVDAAVARWRR